MDDRMAKFIKGKENKESGYMEGNFVIEVSPLICGQSFFGLQRKKKNNGENKNWVRQKSSFQCKYK